MPRFSNQMFYSKRFWVVLFVCLKHVAFINIECMKIDNFFSGLTLGSLSTYFFRIGLESTGPDENMPETP